MKWNEVCGGCQDAIEGINNQKDDKSQLNKLHLAFWEKPF
jgi:hypothetical protein